MPAAGRLMAAAVPVPCWITPWSAYVSSAATFGPRTRVPDVLSFSISFPFGPRTLSNPCGA